MNKIIKASVILMALVLVLVAFASCEKECVHQGGEATCTAKAVCELCGTEYGELAAHKEVYSSGLDATCTEPGYTVGMKCSVCNEVFVAVQPISPTGHSMEEKEAVSATCSSVGYTAHKECAVCGATEDKNEISMLEHTLEDVEGLDATCTEDGYTAHQKCTVCNAEVGKEAIPAGHALSDVEAKEATCTEDGYTAHKACSNCDYTEGKEVLPAVGSHTPGAEATCTTAQICTVCNGELVAKLGHIDENGDVECDREGCTSKVAPPADTVLSNYTANNLGSKLSTEYQYYVVGTIVEVLDQKNGIFLVDDGTGETFYFRLPKNADGVSHASWKVKLTLGDKVQIYGKINKYSTSAAPNGQYWPAMQSPVVTLLEQHPHDFTISPADCTNPAYCTCGQSYGEPRGCVDTDGDSLCDDCGKNTNYKYEYVEIRTDNESGVRDDVAGTYTWSSKNFDVQVVKGTSSQLYSTSKDHMRVYKGNDFVLVNKNGLAVKTIIVYLTNATQVGNLEKLLTGYTYTKDEEKFTITITVDSLETLTITNTASTTQIMGVEFGYEKPVSKPVTVVMDNTITDTQTSYFTGANDAELVGLDSTIFSVVADKGSYGGHAALYYKSTLAAPSQIRLYNHASANGNSIKVSVAEGYEIVSIKITFAIVGRANGYVITDADGKEIANVATDATIENVDVEYDVNSGSFTIKNVHTGNSKQIWIDAIEITYNKK